MRIRGFLLSFDALIALAFAALAMSVVLVISQTSVDAPDFARLGVLGRDYLVLKYARNHGVSPSDFSVLTGLQLTETQPTDSLNWAKAEYSAYPPFFGCANSLACVLASSSANASYGLSQELPFGYQPRSAWVRP